MKDIDFLPIRYRERTAQLRARIWRGVVVCCLAGFVAVVALAQLALQRPIDRQLVALNARYPAAVAAARHTDQLQKELAEIEGFAAMYTYLRHPWPVTQLLACLTEPLPESVVITEIVLDRKPNARNSGPDPNDPASTPSASVAETVKRDLDRLRSAADGTTASVHVSGVTSDATKLHGFVNRLAPSVLFKAAKIESLEAVTSDSGLVGSRFELRLVVRPGYGQPGGPDQPVSESPTSLASRSTDATDQP